MAAPHTETGSRIEELLAAASPGELNDAVRATELADDIAVVLVYKDKLEAMDTDAEWLRGYMAGIGAADDIADRIWDTERLRQP